MGALAIYGAPKISLLRFTTWFATKGNLWTCMLQLGGACSARGSVEFGDARSYFGTVNDCSPSM